MNAPSPPWHLGVNTLFLIPGRVGGSETYLIETLQAMLKLHAGPCTLFTNRENDAGLRERFDDGRGRIRFDRLDFAATNRYQRIVREQVQLAGRVRRAKCDVLWSPGYTACLLTRCPQLVTIFDMQYRRFPHDLSPLAWLTTHLLVSLAVRRCRMILTTSAFSKTEIVDLLRVSPTRVGVTSAAADAGFDGSATADAVSTATPYLLCVANSYPHKNLVSLVQAFDAVADQIPHRLVLVGGPGRGEAALKAALRTAHHATRIERRAGLTREQLAALYRGAALFVFPSLYEGFGLPVLEAMRAGVPVLTTRCASLPEVGGDAADYADSGEPRALVEALLRVLARPPEERAARILAAKQHAATFTWAKTASITYAAAQSLVGT